MIVNKCVCSLQLCCFVYPLRKGLLVWGYLNLARSCFLDGISTAITAARIRYHFQYRDAVEYQDLVSIACIFLVTLCLALTALTFNIVLLVGIYKRDERLLRRCYYYWLVILASNILFIIVSNILSASSQDISLWLAYHIDPVTYHMALVKPAIGAVVIVVQIYFLVLVRNLIRNLNKGDEQAFIDNNYDLDNPSQPRTVVGTFKEVINTQPTRDAHRF